MRWRLLRTFIHHTIISITSSMSALKYLHIIHTLIDLPFSFQPDQRRVGETDIFGTHTPKTSMCVRDRYIHTHTDTDTLSHSQARTHTHCAMCVHARMCHCAMCVNARMCRNRVCVCLRTKKDFLLNLLFVFAYIRRGYNQFVALPSLALF